MYVCTRMPVYMRANKIDCMPKESWPILYSKLLYKLGQDFLERQYKTKEIEKNHTEGVRAERGVLDLDQR